MYNVINRLARLAALAGGFALSGLVVITCLSIIGRMLNGFLHGDFLQTNLPSVANYFIALGVGPINGDYEIVQAGMAFAVFAFLPLCHLNGAHASVGIFTSMLPLKLQQWLLTLIEIVFAATLIIIAVQLFAGMESKRSSGQSTLQLQYPIWWAYAFSFSGAVLAAIVSGYVALMRVIETITGRAVLPQAMDASH